LPGLNISFYPPLKFRNDARALFGRGALKIATDGMWAGAGEWLFGRQGTKGFCSTHANHKPEATRVTREKVMSDE
jgi:hypothetical protein